tara:strand:- start:6550 stop:6768 length:219 start_codon:yes stop_codon:yes gene_type:complete
MKKDLPILDLHGVYYVEVENTLSNFFFWDDHKEGIIITGNSYDMRKLVTEWLEGYDFLYYIEPHNQGRIIVK